MKERLLRMLAQMRFLLLRWLRDHRSYEVAFSRNGLYYYVCRDRSLHANCWMSVEKHDLPCPKGVENWITQGAVSYDNKYWRKTLSFLFFF